MARFIKDRSSSIGKAPGSMVFIGNQKVEKIDISVIEYDEEFLKEHSCDLNHLSTCRDTSHPSWINVNGLHDIDTITAIGEQFELHNLLLEDVVNTGQRPRVEEFENCLAISIKMIRFDSELTEVVSEQLTLVLGKNFLITFQEQPGDVFEPVRERIRAHKGKIRSNGCNYLLYALLDAVVDNYLDVISRIGSEIEDLEEEVLYRPTQDLLYQINDYKMEINYLRKTVRPVREILVQLLKLDTNIISHKTHQYFKDLNESVLIANDAIESYKIVLADQLNIYHTNMTNKLNDVMKVLTGFSVIFIPLTFIAGIYGTNFEYLPELKYKHAYFVFWGVLITTGVSMYLFFKRKGWL